MSKSINITVISQCRRLIGMYLGSPYNKRELCSIIYQVNLLVIIARIGSLQEENVFALVCLSAHISNRAVDLRLSCFLNLHIEIYSMSEFFDVTECAHNL